jgi:hypothetical protein
MSLSAQIINKTDFEFNLQSSEDNNGPVLENYYSCSNSPEQLESELEIKEECQAKKKSGCEARVGFNKKKKAELIH